MNTLKETIEGRNINIKLGMIDGSGFVYCGNIADLNTEEIDRYLVEEKCANITNCVKEIASINRRLAKPDRNYIKYVDAQKERGNEYLAKEEWIQSLKDRLSMLSTRRLVEVDKLINYKPIGNRDVAESYRSITENAMIILIDGDELGRAWTTEEYKKGVYH